jgi:hypothetical protein
MPRLQTTAQARRRGGERGSLLVEAAFVVPIFLALLIGAIEGGFIFYERLTVNNMSMSGARAASGMGSDVLADYHILHSVGTDQSGMAGGQISMIVVYKAVGSASVVPAGCRSASVANSCNRYVGADLTKDATQFGCTGPPGPTTKIDNAWCPTGRKTALGGANGPPDYVGVYVEAQHANLTGMFGKSVTLRSDTVYRMEPRTLI